MSFWHVSFDVPAELAEAAAWLLAERLDTSVETQDTHTMDRGAGDGTTRVVVRFGEAPPETLPAQIHGVLSGLGLANAPLRTARHEGDDWREGWKAFFHLQRLSERFAVRPPWEPDHAEAQHTIIINPGLAFGTGSHATTRGVMKALDHLLGDRPPMDILDVGTGSAILAIAAAKLGHRAVGVEIDALAVDSARENLTLNGAEATVDLQLGSAGDIERTFPLVIANIIAPILIAIAPEIAARAEHDLILSGLLEAQEADVRAAYPGFERIERFEEGPIDPTNPQETAWIVLHLRRRP